MGPQFGTGSRPRWQGQRCYRIQRRWLRRGTSPTIRSTRPVPDPTQPPDIGWGLAKAVPRLHALGPLRGDNFCRFAIHDGWGVLRAMEQSGEMGEAVKPKKKRGQRKAKSEL